MLNLKIENYFKLVLLISLISIISAYYIEYVLGHKPCNLCLIERIPYGLSIFLITLNFFIKKDIKFFVLLLIIIFIFSFIVSVYHLGIEQGFFQESVVCGLKDTSEILTKEELLKQLNRNTVSCKDVTFRVFGLSLTTINIGLSLFIIILSTRSFINYEKFKN